MLAIALIVLLLVSGVGLIAAILLHSGKGTGVADMVVGSLYSTQTGTKVVERNLDRITVALAAVFMASLLALMVVYPQGSIG